MKKNKLFLLIICLCFSLTSFGQVKLKFKGKKVILEATDIINVSAAAPAQNDNAIKGIMRSLMGEQHLDVIFHMSDESIEEGLFVFGIESEIDMLLTIQVFDEEAFAMEVSSSIEIFIGSNYKALNVMELEDGKYFLLLEDEKGRELIRELTIAKRD